MPDLDDLALDRAFTSLTRDLAHSPGPGAAAAIRTSRNRRRTRVGAVALATALVVGGGMTLPRLVFPEGGVAADGGSARFDTAALTQATEGWITDWEDWERYSPWGGGGFGAASCSTPGTDTSAPEPASSGTSRFVSHSGASAVVLVQHYADDARATSAQELSSPAPGTCGTTTLIEVDGVEVRHDSMAPEGDAVGDMWLGDIWSARIGDSRAEVQLVNDTGVAAPATAEDVAEALVAGLRDGWTQSGTTDVVEAPDAKGQLPDWPDVDLDGALAGWQAASRSAATSWPTTPCLGEMLASGGASTSAGGTPFGVTHRIVGFDEEQSAAAKVKTMLAELRGCQEAGMSLEMLPNGVHLATYDLGGDAGRGALWFATYGDRAGLVGVDGADRPMPMGAREDVADALRTILLLPWE